MKNYVVSKFEQHTNAKQKILDAIDTFTYKRHIDSASDIHKTDWSSNVNTYLCVIDDDLQLHMKKVFSDLGFSKFLITDLWFQQYIKGSRHDWHVHQRCQWTNIYYLEFPELAVGTEFIDPFSKEIFSPEVSEGCILTIPSYMQHRAPLVTEDIRRTVISFNCDAFN
jgi:hypothetical protein